MKTDHVVFGSFADRMGALSYWCAYCTMLTTVIYECLD